MTKKRLKSKKPEPIKKLPPTLAVNSLMHGGGFSFFRGRRESGIMLNAANNACLLGNEDFSVIGGSALPVNR